MIVVIDIKVIRTVNSLLASVEDNCQYMQVKTNKRYKEDYTTPVKTISRDDIYNILLQLRMLDLHSKCSRWYFLATRFNL